MSLTNKNKENIKEDIKENIIEDYLICYKILKNKHNILKSDNTINKSIIQSYPQINYGFHHWIHDLKKEKEQFIKFENKKKIYKVLNKFNINIDDYTEDLNNRVQNFFKIDNVISDNFMKIWELLFYFDIIGKNDSNFISLQISKDNSSISQSIISYRNEYCTSTKDKYYILENNNKSETEFRNKNKKKITFVKSVDNLEKTLKNKVNLIIGSCKYEENIKEHLREQSVMVEIFEQIVCAAKCQKKGGTFICKFYEMYTVVSLKFIAILQELYNEVYISKPLTSDRSKTEKFIVCLNYKLDNQSSKIKILDSILNKINKLNNKEYLTNIFNNFTFDNNFKTSIININTFMSNIQFKSVNEILDYIKERNYHGNTYKTKHDNQIKGTIYWTNLFLSKSKDIDKNKKKCKELLKTHDNKLTSEYNRLDKVLIK